MKLTARVRNILLSTLDLILHVTIQVFIAAHLSACLDFPAWESMRKYCGHSQPSLECSDQNFLKILYLILSKKTDRRNALLFQQVKESFKRLETMSWWPLKLPASIVKTLQQGSQSALLLLLLLKYSSNCQVCCISTSKPHSKTYSTLPLLLPWFP